MSAMRSQIILPLLQVTLGNHVEIQFKLGHGSAVVEGNPVEVHQLVMNLCKNASQASARGQSVTIDVQTVQFEAGRCSRMARSLRVTMSG